VRVAVYDATGRARRVLVDAVQAAGRHMATWDGRGGRGIALPAGVYFVRLAFDGHVETQKLVLAP
jgi:flagellar hook assembly protein FlgD